MYEWVVQTVWLASQNAGILTYNELSFLALTGLIVQAPVVQRLDNAIHQINCYPADKCYTNKARYPVDSDLFVG